jgi:DNA-binding transcriptional MerR regulator
MSDETLLSTRKLKQRYSVTDRTILRWEQRGVLPAATWIAKHKYWRLSDIERIERENLRVKTA